MEERMDRIENITLTTVRLCEVMDENFRRMDENHRRIEENQAEIRTLLLQLSQAVAVLQADVVRIDETHA